MRTIISALALLGLVAALAGCGGGSSEPAMSASEQAAFDAGYDNFYWWVNTDGYDPDGYDNILGLTTGQDCWDAWYGSEYPDPYINTAAGEVEADVPEESPYWDMQILWQNGCDAAEEDYLADE